MFFSNITAAIRTPEKLSLLFRCVFLVFFLIIMIYFSMATSGKDTSDPARRLIKSPFNSTVGEPLRTLQPFRSQEPTIFLSASSN